MNSFYSGYTIIPSLCLWYHPGYVMYPGLHINQSHYGTIMKYVHVLKSFN